MIKELTEVLSVLENEYGSGSDIYDKHYFALSSLEDKIEGAYRDFFNTVHDMELYGSNPEDIRELKQPLKELRGVLYPNKS